MCIGNNCKLQSMSGQNSSLKIWFLISNALFYNVFGRKLQSQLERQNIRMQVCEILGTDLLKQFASDYFSIPSKKMFSVQQSLLILNCNQLNDKYLLAFLIENISAC